MDNYYMDHRVIAADTRKPQFDESRMLLFIPYENDEETVIEIPAKFEICDTCSGKGSHVNPSIDSHGITYEEMYEDPDFADEYFSGSYDVTCNGCNGKRVVPVPDEDRMSKEQIKLVNDWYESEASYAHERAYERRMGY